MASNVSPMRPLIATAAIRFDMSRSTFRAASSFNVQSFAIVRQFVVAVWRRLIREDGFDEALRHQIGEAPVRRRGVRVVLHGEAEVAVLRISRSLEDVLAGPHQLDDRRATESTK